MYAGSFEAFDQDEFVALKELQLRAVQYIKYQMAFSKDRLKFCLIEDTIQECFQILIKIVPPCTRDDIKNHKSSIFK